MAYKCCAVYCRFNHSGEEVAVIFSFPRDVYISKFSSITRLKIEKKIFFPTGYSLEQHDEHVIFYKLTDSEM